MCLGVLDVCQRVVLGDRFGSSCDSVFVDEIEAALSDAGFRVARNTPFAGAYITQAYGTAQLWAKLFADRSGSVAVFG